ncbi:MAG: fluoride efflux transporter CrcB [Tenuifilaceae bacterium]|jgi:CrcB protein|nr:fluoride efflux transporter CrcB [Tenuifilaceae bacterium]
MKNIIAIGIGSFIGAVLRYLLTQFIQSKLLSTFPFGTLTVNIVGCLLIGLVFGVSAKVNLSQEWRLFPATGLLGGFTTFSAFSYETINLLRDGQFWYASTYVVSSVVVGLVATFIGITIIKYI